GRPQQPAPMAPQGPMGPMGPGGPFGPAGPGGPGGGPRGGSGGGFSPYGGSMSGFDQGGQRLQIRYVPLEDLDKEMAAGKTPAMTVVPLRMVVVYATFPIKEQIAEFKRALRQRKDQPLPPDLEPVFDGFEVQRRISLPNGQIFGQPMGTRV